MNKGTNSKYWHWLETPKPRVKKVERKTGLRNFLRKLVNEILGSWQM
jgi:hypothetical protein